MAKDIYPTKHLLEKLDAREVTWGEIVEVVEHPEVVYGPDYRGKKIHQKGDLSVVVAPDGAVLTVLLRDEKQWNDEQARERSLSEALEANSRSVSPPNRRLYIHATHKMRPGNVCSVCGAHADYPGVLAAPCVPPVQSTEGLIKE